MTYYAASTSSSTNQSVIDFIETGLTAHAGWSFIEATTFTHNSFSKTARVWKCLGTQNSSGLDFYLFLVKFTDGTGPTVGIRMSEGYNTSTKGVMRPVPLVGNGTAPVSGTDFSIGNGTEYALTLGSGTGAQQESLGTAAFYPSGTLDHFMVVSKSFVAYSVNASGTALGGFYAGNFNPTYSSTYNPVMLIATNAMGGATRFPNCTVIPTNGDAAVIPATYPSGYLTTFAVPDKFRNVLEASGVLVVGAQATNAAAGVLTSGGGLRGSLPTSVMLKVAEAGTTLRNGDFFSVSGTEYFRVGYSGSAVYSVSASSPNQSFYISKVTAY